MPCLGVFGRPVADGERKRFGWLSDVQLEESAGGGHFVHLVDPDRFATRLRQSTTALLPAEEHLLTYQVTPLELFFDLVFVFAITQVTTLLAHTTRPGRRASRETTRRRTRRGIRAG